MHDNKKSLAKKKKNKLDKRKRQKEKAYNIKDTVRIKIKVSNQWLQAIRHLETH